MESAKDIDLTNLGLLLKEKINLVKHETKQMNELKKEIREIMVKNDVKDFENEEFGLSIKCQRSFSFDVGMFKLEEKELAKEFVKEETIITVKDVFDKKYIEKYRPDIYRKYLVENTPRLTVR